MTRKELQEKVDFRLLLNEWAASQPGYKSRVTAADVEAGMAKVRSVLQESRRGEGKFADDQAKLKYSVLVQIIKKDPPKTKLPISMEVEVVKDQLLKEKLLAPSKSRGAVMEFDVTDLGRRYVEDFEQSQKTDHPPKT
jgi:hypothetical protein